MNRKDILNEIVDYYKNSRDFNGLPIYKMINYEPDELCILIDEGLVEAISEKDVLNPHIRMFDFKLPIAKQKENARNTSGHTVFYPTKLALNEVETNNEKPYTALLKKGYEKFKLLYFDIEILERYINNPKFIIMDYGYRGKIYPKDKFCNDIDIDSDYIKDYGMAYIEAKQLKRAVGVFLTDLSKLSLRRQLLWKSFELTNQNDCKINSGFIENLVEGKWVTKIWIFHALLDEMIIINKQCVKMEIPELFNKIYGTHYSEMPEGYRNILYPTLKNYYDFVLVMEKITVHNISIKTFQKNSLGIQAVDRIDSKGELKGSLIMFNEWLNVNISTDEDLSEIVIFPLRNIRKIRQKPAHELISNTYDENIFQKQIELMEKTYTAIRAIRLFFSNHPLSKGIDIPEYLLSGKNIVSY